MDEGKPRSNHWKLLWAGVVIAIIASEGIALSMYFNKRNTTQSTKISENKSQNNEKVLRIENKNGGQAEFVVPPESLHEFNRVKFTAVGWNSNNPDLTGGTFQFSPEGHSFYAPFELRISLPKVPIKQPTIYYFNTTNQVWFPIKTVVKDGYASITITMLGTYALGYDSTPPEIQLSYPEDNEHTSSQFLIHGRIIDSTVGLDQDSVKMFVDNIPVTAKLLPNGEFQYIPEAAFSLGSHTIKITAADNSGNEATSNTVFIVDKN